MTACLLLMALASGLPGGAVSGDATIRGPFGESEIVIRTTTRTAGAVDSLVWNGREFLDSFDHGRQLQSAANFDAAHLGAAHLGGNGMVPETFNPTEAGSLFDATGPTSTSRLFFLSANTNRLETRSQMAFWLRPGERSAGHLARNREPLSDHELRKAVTIGPSGLPANVIEHTATFTIPSDERHTVAQFEAVTAYLPPGFSAFLAYDPATDRMVELSDGPGEQSLPVVFTTSDGAFAMGVVAAALRVPKGVPEGVTVTGPGYGRFRFAAERVVKWNVVYRVCQADAVPAGDYSFTSFIAVGTLEDVRRGLRAAAEPPTP